jgi:hypothetical protein
MLLTPFRSCTGGVPVNPHRLKADRQRMGRVHMFEVEEEEEEEEEVEGVWSL